MEGKGRKGTIPLVLTSEDIQTGSFFEFLRLENSKSKTPSYRRKKLQRPSPMSSSIRPIISLSKQQALRRQLENCHLIAGIYCNGLSTKQLQKIRGSLPPSTKLIIARNSLMEQTLKGTKWEPLKFCATGMNAWLFVHGDEDSIPAALKPYRDFQKKEGLGFNDFRGAVFEGKVYGPDDFAELESMPTRMESYSYFLGCLQTPAAWLLGILEERQRRLAVKAADTVEGSTDAAAPAPAV